MARKLPDPSERTEKDPAVLCGSARVLALYNNAHAQQAQRVSNKVKSWFLATAQTEGWDSAIFIKEVETGHSAGCVLYKRPVNVLVNLFIGVQQNEEEE